MLSIKLSKTIFLKCILLATVLLMVVLLVSRADNASAQSATTDAITDTIAMVNTDPISVQMFQQRVRFARWSTAQQLLQVVQTYGEKALTDPQSPYYAQLKALADSAALGKQVLDSLVTIKLVKQEAAKRKIAVSDEERQQQIYTFFGYTPGATPQPTLPGMPPPPDTTQIAQTFTDHRDNYFGQVGNIARMTQNDVLDTFTEQVLQVKVYEAVAGDVPKEAEQVKVRQILADTEANANAWLAQIKNGTDFAQVAQANSLDSTSAALGGDLGWSPKDTYLSELEQAIWSAPLGQVIGPIKTQFGYHILLVEAREVHPLSVDALARERERLYQQWLAKTRQDAQIQIVENWQSFVPAAPSLKELGLPEIQ